MPKKINNIELVKFITKYGRKAIGFSRSKLDKQLTWFLKKRRLILINEKNTKEILLLFTFIIVESLKELELDDKLNLIKWPEDNPKGKYIFVPFIVINPKIKNRGFMQKVLGPIKKMLPHLKHVVFFRKKKFKINNIDTFLGKEKLLCHF